MKFSQQFKITKTAADDWFDPDLDRDTGLFIDPFLLYALEVKELRDASQNVIDFFNIIFKLVASAKAAQKDFEKTKTFETAVKLLSLGEFSGLWLGYTEDSNEGSGLGPKLARATAKTIGTVITKNFQSLNHIESIRLYQKGIGPDRLSDSVAGILRENLAAYTQKVCKKHTLPTQLYRFKHGTFNLNTLRWESFETMLPFKDGTEKPILLVPRSVLRELPSIDTPGFWNYCKAYEVELLRKRFDNDIKRRVARDNILAFARDYPGICDQFITYTKDTQPFEPYDFEMDRLNYELGYFKAESYVLKHPYPTQITSLQALPNFLASVVQEFKHFIENETGWRRLWVNAKNYVPEKSLHNLFYALLKHYTDAQNITFKPKLRVGEKPLNFTMENGGSLRTFFRLRYMRNLPITSKLQSDLYKELNVKDCESIDFVVITLSEKEREREEDFQRIFRKASTSTKFGNQVKLTFIDGRNRRISAP